MKTALPIGFGAAFGLALLLLTLQFFLTPLYLEIEYEYPGFPPPQPLSSDQRYTASQAFLSYLNVEGGCATLLSLSELSFGRQPFFSDGDLACIFRAKELRASAFGLTFVLGVVTIAAGLFIAADDFDRARRAVLISAFCACLAYTALSIVGRLAFDQLSPLLFSLISSSSCTAGAVRGLPEIFPPAIFRDAFVLMALFARFEAVVLGAAAWLFGRLARMLSS